ncbi:hairy/enhancer-of-split related with YRPW motif protein-like isoform X1 [Limulus polyphemus]|uniref:Hairy/enhancer-of-split related with YRPW motif protein-like isoform X1 n=1 Tax=Limulus polyphemus TaxID=6850 RepID=A0ABM1RWT6_LIMPO|nr:hairy/enhancer-of-split related with YRPW motif protein-like isoform X1 [Limulus polyphemus]
MADLKGLETERKERRKIRKSKIEKRRRERINQSLAELKELLSLVDPNEMCETSTHTSKRRAEMLEKLVLHLRYLHTKFSSEVSTMLEAPPGEGFIIGYRKCMTEIARFLSANEYRQSPEFMPRLFCHLNRRLQENNKRYSEKSTKQTDDLLVPSDSSQTQEENSRETEPNHNELPVKNAFIGPGFFSSGYYFWPVYNRDTSSSDFIGRHPGIKMSLKKEMGSSQNDNQEDSRIIRNVECLNQANGKMSSSDFIGRHPGIKMSLKKEMGSSQNDNQEDSRIIRNVEGLNQANGKMVWRPW